MTENDCPICYESITQTTGCCILSCSHSFHIKCLTQWTSDASTCPMCRHSLTEIEMVPKPPERDIDFIIDEQSIERPSNSEVAEYMRNYLANRGSFTIHPPRPGQGRTSMVQDILEIASNSQQRRWFSIAPYTFTTEERITQVIQEAGVTRNRAIQELRESAGNVDEAILMARVPRRRYVPSTPPTPRNPLEPTDEMITAWALERLFKYGTIIDDSYDYGSFEDTMHRTNVTRFSGRASSLWMNSDFIGAEVRDRSPSI